MSISSDELQKGVLVVQDQWQQLSQKTEWDEVKLLQQVGTSIVSHQKLPINTACSMAQAICESQSLSPTV